MKYLLMTYGNQDKWESMPPEAWPEAIAKHKVVLGMSMSLDGVAGPEPADLRGPVKLTSKCRAMG